MRRIVWTTLVILLMAVCFCACRNDGPVTVTKCNVTFNLDVTGYTNANIKTYVIQIRCIPLFGDFNTPGRVDNWKTVQDNKGTFTMTGLQAGNWTFYIRVIDSGQILQEIFSGTRAVTPGLIINLGEAPSYAGFGKLGIYIRADRIAEKQTLKVYAENVTTAVKYDFSGAEWASVEKGTTYVDYAYVTDAMPVGNYVFHVAVTVDDSAEEAMSMEDMVAVKSTEDGILVMRLRAERFVEGGIEIEGEFRMLEGIVSGPTSGKVGEKMSFRFIPINSYTQENTVWYWWYVDGRRVSSRVPELNNVFTHPGLYLISCVPVGINGEIPKDGASLIQVAIGVAEEN